MTEECCSWCASRPGKQHARWCPCSSAMRRKIRNAYQVSDYQGMSVANKIRGDADRNKLERKEP